MLLINILQHNLDKLLLQQIILTRILEQKTEKFALGVKLLKSVPVDQSFQRLLKVVRQQLFQLGLRVEECYRLEEADGRGVDPVLVFIGNVWIKLVLKTAHEK